MSQINSVPDCRNCHDSVNLMHAKNMDRVALVTLSFKALLSPLFFLEVILVPVCLEREHFLFRPSRINFSERFAA